MNNSYGKNPKFAFLRDTSMRDTITDSEEKSSAVSEKNPKKDGIQHSLRRRQVNPIIEDKALQEEYAEELSKNEYTPEMLEQWDREAVKRNRRQRLKKSIRGIEYMKN